MIFTLSWPSKWKKKRKCKKTSIKFGNIRRGMYIIKKVGLFITIKKRFQCNVIFTKLSIITKDESIV